jgi:hypothetical protein
MSQSDVFALKNSALNAFLLADIGEEINGSKLTVLSALARLGKDPWAEAAKWDRQPKAHAIEALTASIIDMPLNSEAIHDARSTASRLVLLLPKQAQPEGASSRTALAALPNWAWMVILYPWILMALHAELAPPHTPSPATAQPAVLPPEPSQ